MFDMSEKWIEELKLVVYNIVLLKVIYFSYGLWLFYVVSEFGYRDKLFVGILIIEENIDLLVFVVNNIWGFLLLKIIFFILFLRDVDFLEKYNKVLGLLIV